MYLTPNNARESTMVLDGLPFTAECRKQQSNFSSENCFKEIEARSLPRFKNETHTHYRHINHLQNIRGKMIRQTRDAKLTNREQLIA